MFGVCYLCVLTDVRNGGRGAAVPVVSGQVAVRVRAGGWRSVQVRFSFSEMLLVFHCLVGCVPWVGSPPFPATKEGFCCVCVCVCV